MAAERKSRGEDAAGRPGRLVPWGRRQSANRGWTAGLVFVEDPELVEALDQVNASMAAIHRVGGGAERQTPAPGIARREVEAACRELRSLADFLEGVTAAGPEDLELELSTQHGAQALRGVVRDLEDSVKGRNPHSS